MFGILLVFFLASSCGTDEGFDEKQFRGPYELGHGLSQSAKDEKTKKKIDDITMLVGKNLFLSKTTRLNKETSLLKDSIENSSFPYGDKQQKYNYVINLDGEIIVAGWDPDVDFRNVVLDVAICPGGTDFPLQSPQRMINWFPESSANGQSPCWLDTIRKDGLLDAISKHFLLAQGVDRTIRNFNPGMPSEWTDTKVSYAGELIVDLDSCTYSLNNNSGTYLPVGDELKKVAEYFAEEIGVGPFSYVNYYKDTNSSKIQSEIHSTENLSITTTQISTLCPVNP